MTKSHIPMAAFPFGAVYFRKTNPPRDEWERDYGVCADDGLNTFRHWVLWGSIELAPGEFDFSDYDIHFDLAARHGMTTIISEFTHSAPEWVFQHYAHARYERPDGTKHVSGMRDSCVTGGSSGLCLDNEDYKLVAERWLKTLAGHYKDHPSLAGYDVWNETNTISAGGFCYCPATRKKFREWLRVKYGTLEAVATAWHRYSFTDWEQVQPPLRAQPYPEYYDWCQFRFDNAWRLFQWRIDTIRSVDPDCLITAHCAGTHTFNRMTEGADDVWRAAQPVQIYGFGGGRCLDAPTAWNTWIVADMVRSACEDKKFWMAEAPSGPNFRPPSLTPSWMPPQPLKTPRNIGRVPSDADLRLWDMSCFAAGASGHYCNRVRPLMDGPLFGSAGAYAMDGARTPRSEMWKKMANWANSARVVPMWQSRPIRGEMAILFVPDSQVYCTAFNGTPEFYAGSIEGAYQGFFDHNIQVEFAKIYQIDKYKVLYLPYAVLLPSDIVAALIKWVEAGGVLIAEGCPGYFDESGKAGLVQPNHGLDRMFGCRESYVEFLPDLAEDEVVQMSNGTHTLGGAYMQQYNLQGGTAAGHYADGSIGAVENTYGKGKTLLIGTGFGMAYHKNPTADAKAFFGSLWQWTGQKQTIVCDAPYVTARLHSGEAGTYLWVSNPDFKAVDVQLTVDAAWGPFTQAETLWSEEPVHVDGSSLTLRVPARDLVVAKLSA